MKISLIAAMTPGTNIIGKNGGIPWRLPSDLKKFKELTTGKTVVMGRKTYESIGRPLPNRTNIVISKNLNLEEFPGNDGRFAGCTLVSSTEEAMGAAKAIGKDLMVIGGESVYTSFLPYADELLLTYVFGAFDGDTLFPSLMKFDNPKYPDDVWQPWKIVEVGTPTKEEKDECWHIFCKYEKRYG